jgi:hypothetical protein
VRRVLFIAGILLCSAFSSKAADPLSTGFLPSIDANCAHSQYAGNVWMSDWSVKLRQDAGTNPGNACYLTIHATQNEFADFQVHLRDGGSGTAGLKITLGNFVQTSPNSSTITCISGSSCQVYREGYMNVSPHVTATAASFYGVTGVYPDALIPTTDFYTSQATNAWPFTVTAGKNQSAWVDILVPAAAPSGYYLGSAVVQTGCPGSCVTIATMPVILAVWQWPSAGFMPSTATLKSEFGLAGEGDFCAQVYGGYVPCAAWPGAMGSSDLAETLGDSWIMQLYMDHRISVSYPSYPPSTTVFTTFETYYGPLLSGTANTLLGGAKMNTLGMYGCHPPTHANNWATEFSGKGWTLALFCQTVDEPGATCGNWTNAISYATTLHGATPPIPALVTTNLTNATNCSALNAVDIMTTLIDQLDPNGGSLQRSTYNTWLAGNCCGGSGPTRRLWTYISCDPWTCSNNSVGNNSNPYPNYDIDGLPTSNRVNEWLSFWHTISGELSFATTCMWQTAGCAAGGSPWTNVYAFGEWGDGTDLYPSTSGGTNYVTQPNGSQLATPIAVPSIRMKLRRDGMQDYEYLTVLTANGKSALAQTEITNWITNTWTWERTGSGLNSSRIGLGNAMHALTFPSTTPTITTMSLPAGTFGVAYNQTISATGGTPPYTFSISAGALPPGVTMSALGSISGTPTSIGTFNFTVMVTDSLSQTGTQPLSIVVAAPAPPPVNPPTGTFINSITAIVP